MGERTRAALTTHTFFVDIKVPWAKLKHQLCMIALPNKIRMDIQLNTQARVIQDIVPGTTATSGLISNVFCRCKFVHRKSVDRDREFQQVHAQPLNTKIFGFEYHRRENVDANSALGTIITNRVKLRNIKNDAVQIYATLCNQVDVDGSTSGTLNPFNFQDLPQLTFWLEDNGTQITDFFILDNYSKYLENARAYPGIEPGNWPVRMLNLCPPDLELARRQLLWIKMH